MQAFHKIDKISFENSFMIIDVDGKHYKIDLKDQSKKLLESDIKFKENYIISPSGYGIHWPDIDEDLSIDGLIGIKHNGPEIGHIEKVS
jgi:hypothetical protein